MSSDPSQSKPNQQAVITQLHQQGDQALEAGKIEAAIANYQKIITIDSQSVMAYQKLGKAFSEAGKLETAISAYQKVIQLDPNFFWAYNNLGEALIKQEQWQAAIPIYQKAIELDPNFSWAYGNLATALKKLERPQAAAEVYQNATKFNPDLFWLQDDYAEILMDLKRWQQAESVLRQAIQLEPKSHLTHYKLGKVLMQLQSWEDAIICFQTTLKLQPDFKSAQHKLKEAIHTLDYIQHPTDKTPITQLESVDFLKYYPVWGESHSYIFYKSEKPSQDPQTKQWNFPLPPKELMFVFDTSPETYLDSGKVQISILQETLEKADRFIQPNSRILDFGCASGRIIRHLVNFSETCEIWGTDISGDCISWCQQNLSPPFHFFMATTHPHLPFEDGYFDLIYAGSVFTHIDDLADAWFLELRRILKPGGLAYITIQEQHLINIIKDFSEPWLDQNNIWLPDQKNECYQKYHEYSQSDFSMFTLGRDTRSLVFYDLDHFCQKRQPWFKTLGVRREAYYWQTAVLLERQ